MRKLIYLSTLLLLFVLPMMAQHPLFPTPAKVQNGKGSFVIGKNLQVQGNGGYADKLAAGLQTELKEAGLQSSPAKPLPKPACSMRRKPFCNFPVSAKVTCVPVRYKISPATAGAVSCSTRAATSSVKRR